MARGRPRQALLSKDLIVDTAMELIDSGARLNLSRVARELSVHVSSLYNHVGDRDGLIELMRARLAEEYPVPSLDGLSWQEVLRAVATTIHSAFLAHPGLVPYLANTPVSSPEIVEVYSRVAESMLDAGHDRVRTSLAIRLIDTLAFGTALVTSTEPTRWRKSTRGGNELMLAAERWTDDRDQTAEAFELGLGFIITGLEKELATP